MNRPHRYTITPGPIHHTLLPVLLGLATVSLACGQARAVAPPSPAAATAPRTAQPTPVRLLWATEDLSVRVQGEVKRWAEAHGLAFIAGPASDLTPSSVAGGLEWVVSLHEVAWDEDPAFMEAGVRGVVVDPTRPASSPFVSTIGATDASWKEAGFLAGVLTGLIGESQVAGVVADDDQWLGDLAAGFDQGLRYTCPSCRQVRVEAASLESRELVRQGANGVFVAPGSQSGEAAAIVTEAGLWVVWVGEVPLEIMQESLAGRVAFEPAALVAQALDALAGGEGGQSWSYSVATGSMAFSDVDPQAISPGRQRLADQAEQKLASGELDLDGP